MHGPIEAAIHEYVESRRGLHRVQEIGFRDRELRLSRLARVWLKMSVLLADISGHSSFEAWHEARRKDGFLRYGALNEYQAAAFQFCKWLEKRIGTNPVAVRLERIESLGDQDVNRLDSYE